MPLAPEDKRKVIEHLVHDFFIPEHNRKLATFLAKYTEQVRQNILMQIQVNMSIKYEPLKFDITEPINELIDNILSVEVIFKK